MDVFAIVENVVGCLYKYKMYILDLGILDFVVLVIIKYWQKDSKRQRIGYQKI